MINIERIKQIKAIKTKKDFKALPRLVVQKGKTVDPLNYAIYSEVGSDYFFNVDRTDEWGYRVFFEYESDFYSHLADQDISVRFSITHEVSFSSEYDALKKVYVEFYDPVLDEALNEEEETFYNWHMYKKESHFIRRIKFLSDGISLNDKFDPDGVIQDYWRLGSYEEEKLLSDFPIFQKQEAA